MRKILSFLLATALFFGSGVGLFGGTLLTGQAAEIDDKVYASSEKTYVGLEEIYAGLDYDGSEETIYARGGGLTRIVQEQIDYAYKVEDEYINPYKLPNYLSDYTCGISAGGNIIGRFDKEYEELIPNHTGRIFWGQWLWGSQDAEVDAMFSSLYTRMGATSAGVTLNGYKTGMSSYTSSRGRTMVQAQCMSGSTLNSSQYKPAFKDGKLMSVFMEGFAFITFGEFLTYSNYDKLTHYVYTGSHIVAAYGYLDVSYYNAQNQCFRKDSYLYVASGFSEGLMLVKLNQYCVIDDGYINDIY